MASRQRKSGGKRAICVAFSGKIAEVSATQNAVLGHKDKIEDRLQGTGNRARSVRAPSPGVFRQGKKVCTGGGRGPREAPGLRFLG